MIESAFFNFINFIVFRKCMLSAHYNSLQSELSRCFCKIDIFWLSMSKQFRQVDNRSLFPQAFMLSWISVRWPCSQAQHPAVPAIGCDQMAWLTESWIKSKTWHRGYYIKSAVWFIMMGLIHLVGKTATFLFFVFSEEADCTADLSPPDSIWQSLV